jgi:hypothetical protein
MVEKLEALSADEAYDAPDWEAQREELSCPLCEYNLRGLREPRCPECGYRFVWADLTDPARRVHPYLFEHHPERNGWSFWKTAVGGLRPVRFWKSLSPTQPQRPFRMILYWVLTMFIALLCVAGIYFLGYWRLHDQYGAMRAYFRTITPFPAIGANDVMTFTGHGYLIWWVWGLLWPWLTFLSLMIFRISMRRARVKSLHVLRCVLYSADGLLWGGLCLVGTAAASSVSGEIENPGSTVRILYTVAVCGSAVLVAGRLCVAYDRYLRFDHPWLTVLASQVIVLLVGFYLLLEFQLV